MEISKDPLFLILNKLNDKDLINYCSVNKETFEMCNNNQIFWLNRIRTKFPYIPLKTLNKYKKQYYDRWSDYYIKDLRKAVSSDIKRLNDLLTEVSKEGRLDLVMIALNNGADVHWYKDTALKVAVCNGYFEIVKYLVEKGADIYSYNNWPLRMASGRGHLKIVKYLVEKGADIADIYSYNGALRSASMEGHLDVVKFLIEKGANVNANNGYSLRLASMEGHLDVVKYLVEKGANITLAALIDASRTGKLDVVKYLIKKGNIQDQHNDALRMARENNHSDVVAYLESL